MIFNVKFLRQMIEEIRQNIYYYNNPDFVVKFQNLCGLKRKQKMDKAEKENVDYVVENSILYYLFSIGSICGEEFFAILFFSILSTMIDLCLNIQVMLFWSVPMILGLWMKDYYKMARPNSPELIRLETHFSAQYGMPSSHAIAATAIPAGLILSNRININLFVRIIGGAFWCALISMSRLYKGVHSVADICVGILITLGCSTLLYPCLATIEWMVEHQSLSGIILLCLLVSIVITQYPHYPNSRCWNSARTECFTVLGSIFGTLVAISIDCFILQHPHPTINMESDAVNGSMSLYLLYVLRLVVMIITVGLSRVLFKCVLLWILSCVYKTTNNDYTDWRRDKFVEVPFYFSLYTCLGLVSYVIVPRLVDYLGLGRLYF